MIANGWFHSLRAMVKRGGLTISFVAAGLMMGEAAQAHHSFAMFDKSKTIVLHGTMKSVQLTNPHSWFVIVAAGDDGVVKEWGIEGPSPNILLRQGWKSKDVNPGDRVTLTFNPLRSGAAGGVLVSVTTTDGRELSGIPAGAPK